MSSKQINSRTYGNTQKSAQFQKYNYQWNLKTTDQYSFDQYYQRFKRVVLEQITNFIEKKLIYHHYQSGYRKNHATATLLAKLRDGIKKAMKTRKIILAVPTDYSKAFHSINFSVLIKKMHTLSFSKFF